MPLEYISLKEAAAKWRTKPWYIARACDAGQVPDAAKLGDTWTVLYFLTISRKALLRKCFFLKTQRFYHSKK